MVFYMFLDLLILSVVLIAISLAALGVRMLISPGGRFPDTHVGHNKEMKKLGIGCARSTNIGCHSTADFPGCGACREE